MNYNKMLFLFSVVVISIGPQSIACAQDSVPRTWSDTGGTFKINATLVEQGNGTISLKKSDGSVIKVPTRLLSQADRDYLAQLPKQATTQVAVLKDLHCSDREAMVFGNPVLLEAEPLGNLPADRGTAVLPYRSMQTVVTQTDAYDKIGEPTILDSQAGVIAISIGRHVAGNSESQRGRVFRARYGSPRADLLVDAPESVDILDHDIASGTTLAVCGKDNLYRGGEVAVFQHFDSSPTLQLRRTLPGIDTPGFKPDVSWGKMFDASIAALHINDKLAVVNLVKNECVYCVEKITAGAIPALSPGKHYLAIPSGGQAIILDAQSGDTLGIVTVDTLLTPRVHFDPSGTKLLLVFGNSMAVWNLVNAHFETEVTALNPIGDVIGWVNRTLILTSLAGLIDTELEMTVWKYSLPPSSRASAIINGALMTDTSTSGLTLRVLPVPHPAVSKVQKRLAGSAALLVEPGTDVAIEVNAIEGVDVEEFRAAVTTAAEKVGWKVTNQSKITLVATIGRGEIKQLEFTKGVSFGASSGGQKSTVSITPFTAKFEIRAGKDVLWSRHGQNSVPPMLFTSGSETAQEAVSKFERPDANFFASMTLPPKIPKPELVKLIGTSRIHNGQWAE